MGVDVGVVCSSWAMSKRGGKARKVTHTQVYIHIWVSIYWGEAGFGWVLGA